MSTTTTSPADDEFNSARNPNGSRKEPTDAALSNVVNPNSRATRVNVPYNPARWDRVAKLTEPDRELLRWFHLHALEANLSTAKIGEIIGLHRTVAYRVLAGDYAGIYPLESLRAYRAEHDQGPGTWTGNGALNGEREPQFIHTGAADRYLEAMDYAGRAGFAIVAGRSGIGKTRAVNTWNAKHPGRLIKVNAPSIGGAARLAQSVASVMGIGWRGMSGGEVVDRIAQTARAARGKLTIMVDQGSRLIPERRKLVAQSWEVLMDWHEAGAGIVVALTWRNLGQLDSMTYQIEQVVSRARVFSAPELTRDETAAVAAQWWDGWNDRSLERLHTIALNPGALRELVGILNDWARAGKFLASKAKTHVAATDGNARLDLVLRDREKRTAAGGGKSEGAKG